MKTFWTILSVLAVANLLATAAFLGWLKSSDRLDLDRARHVRTMLSKTITQEGIEAAEVKAKAEADAKAAEVAKKAAQPPLTAEQRVALRLEATELDRQRAERLKREVEDLQRVLAIERANLDRDRAAFADEKRAFETASASTRQALDDQQFQKTLGVIASMKPKDAAALFRQMLQPAQPAASSDASTPQANAPATITPATSPDVGIDRVVMYLDAMDEKPRGKIITELAKGDPALATQLLEKIRARAQFAPVPRGPSE